MSIVEKLRTLLALNKLAGILKEAQMKGKLLTALAAIGGAIGAALVAKFTTHCPDLFSNVGALLTTGAMGAFAYAKVKENWSGSLLWGAASAGVAAIISQIKLMCGADFFTVAPTIAFSAVYVGIMAYISRPKL